MKRFSICFAVFAAMFFIVGCGSSNESVYDNVDTSDSESEESDLDDTNSQNDITDDSIPDNTDSQTDDTDTDFSNDSDDALSDNDSDSAHETEIGETREANCTGLPAKAHWNTVSSITQTWNGTDWEPSTEAIFSTTASETKCRFVCNENYSWNDSECVAETRTANCESLPENAVWNSAASITQTWDDENWFPSSTGTYNTNSSLSECRFKCVENYNWNGSQCVATTIQSDCTNLPENAVWNVASSITQTWSGSEWLPVLTAVYNETPSNSECFFKCAENYEWKDSQCIAKTIESDCVGLPLKAHWNTATKIMQTWDGNYWIPSNLGSFNVASSDSECYFQCDEHYTWSSSTSKCDADTQPATCINLPDNAVWNSVSEITQTWNGSDWAPSNIGSFSNATSTSECYFKCKEHYSWSSSTSTCDADSQPAVCIGLPENAFWNNVSFITQTWDGTDWNPSNVGSFSATASSNECHFKCHEHYTWNDSNSTCDADSQPAPCIELPDNAVWNSVSEITQTWNGSDWMPSAIGTYNEAASSEECRFKCADDYHWEDSACVSNTRRADCADLPTGAVRNSASSIIQNWTVENGWQPSTIPTYSTEESASECRYKCDPAYTWENGNCINQRTTACTDLPENAEWNIVSEIPQNWTGSEWIPETTGTFDTSASTEECVFKCKEHYYWTDSICKAESQVSNCEELPAHAHWNTAETISQTWDGLDWVPSTIGTYGEEESTTECRFKCDNYYQWNGALCVVPLARICTGQLRCFNDSREISCPVNGENFFGQDANYANLSCTWPSLTVDDSISDQKTLIDNNTGLEWQQTDSEVGMAWSAAVSYCDELNYGEHDDWRLPTPQELLTLSAVIGDTDYFQATTDRTYWSSGGNCSPGYSSYAWSVDYYNYGGNYFIKCDSTSRKARCVRGNKLPYPIYEEIFSVSGNIIKDPINNLWWQKNRIEGKTWQEALSYCEGHGMRLPNINELASLINYETNISNFPGSIGVDWSSTTLSHIDSSGSSAMMIKSNGTIDLVNKNENYVTKTRCVVSLDEEK